MRCGDHADFNAPGDPGYRECLSRLTIAVQQRLAPFIFRAVRDPHATEDVLQETLLTMIERLSGLRQAECFWPWIYRVARRKIQDHLRQQQRWALAEEGTRCRIERCFTTSDENVDVLDRIINVEDTHRLSDAIGRMDRQQRQIIHLRCFEQLPYAQIARRTRTSPAQARISFHRVKALLRTRLRARSA